jgi:3-dehydroquinate synthase
MRTLSIQGRDGVSRIHVGESIARLADHLPHSCRQIVVTDENVAALHRSRFPRAEEIVLPPGEAAKTLETVSGIYERLVSVEADRSVFLVAIGGGVVCDITGFAASTYLRGVRFAYCPTTLLAQVDASVGGKTGVNFKGYKNMVGLFSQPEFVICDPEVLQTLPEREVACGYAEVVKHAAIADSSYFAFLEDEAVRARSLDPEVTERVVYDSVAIKAAVVNRDEREKGERRKLNFGHTFGHAVERAAGLRHGEAVSIGMMMAARLSADRAMLSEAELYRLERLLAGFGLPLSADVSTARIMDAVCRDKKREGGVVQFVLLEKLGRAVVAPIPVSELEAGG